MRRVHLSIFFFMAGAILLSGAKSRTKSPIAEGLRQKDEFTIVSKKNLYTGHPAIANDKNHIIRVVVEIPAGTQAKWEVTKLGFLAHEFKKGSPRYVNYLGYPANYGMIPRTLLTKERGGDGDALDVVVLGPPLERGSVHRVRVIGIMRMIDGKEQDDKILSVHEHSNFGKLKDMDDLRNNYHGIKQILSTWFESYKGIGKITVRGFGDTKEAMMLVRQSSKDFETEASR